MLNWLAANKDAFAGLASIFTVLGTIVAVVIFCSGLHQYIKAERWRRTEFLAKLYGEFSNDPAAVRAIWMLDGDDRVIFFEEGDKHKEYPVNQERVIEALREYSPENEFSQLDLHIRDSFDVFFVYIEQFDRAIQNRLVDKDDVRPYFAYWIDLLNNQRDNTNDERLRNQILNYVDVIGFVHVQRFLARWAERQH
jgi:hypothetical protein